MTDSLPLEEAPEAAVAPLEAPQAPAGPPAVIPSDAEASVVFKLAKNLARTTFVPKAYQGHPDEIAACILYGRALGIDPMLALQEIAVIQGRPTVSAKYMAGKVLAAGHRIEVIEWTDTECKLRGTRYGQGEDSSLDVTFSLDDAKRAGLLRAGSSWSTYPKAMLMARATSMLARALFADLVLGMAYTAEEMGGEPNPADIGELP
jgi:hypothetical protein